MLFTGTFVLLPVDFLCQELQLRFVCQELEVILLLKFTVEVQCAICMLLCIPDKGWATRFRFSDRSFRLLLCFLCSTPTIFRRSKKKKNLTNIITSCYCLAFSTLIAADAPEGAAEMERQKEPRQYM